MNKGRFPYKLLSKYPHLMPNDIRIWERFIKIFPNFYQSVDYDIKVGHPRIYPGNLTDQYKKDLEYLSKKRIDVVGYRGNEIHIIELKPSANFQAIGQVLGYLELFEPYAPKEANLTGFIITDFEVPDVKDICKKKGLLYVKLWDTLFPNELPKISA